MEASFEEKRELGDLWKIIAAYAVAVISNVLISIFLEEDIALFAGIGASSTIGVLLTILYSILLKPKLNQVLLFIFCLAITLAGIIFMVFDLSYKAWVAGASVPFLLVLCGMWVYAKFVNKEV